MDDKLNTYLSLRRFSGAEELARPSTEPKLLEANDAFPKSGVPFFGGIHIYNKDCSSLVSILRSRI